MTAAALFIELRSAGVLLTAPRGDALQIDAPAGVLSPAMIEQVRQHKPELLRIVSSGTAPNVPEATADDSLECLCDSQCEYVDLAELTPCPKCGTLEQWQNMLGDWRCERCDPTTAKAIAFMDQAERVRQHWQCR